MDFSSPSLFRFTVNLGENIDGGTQLTAGYNSFGVPTWRCLLVVWVLLQSKGNYSVQVNAAEINPAVQIYVSDSQILPMIKPFLGCFWCLSQNSDLEMKFSGVIHMNKKEGEVWTDSYSVGNRWRWMLACVSLDQSTSSSLKHWIYSSSLTEAWKAQGVTVLFPGLCCLNEHHQECRACESLQAELRRGRYVKGKCRVSPRITGEQPASAGKTITAAWILG